MKNPRLLLPLFLIVFSLKSLGQSKDSTKIIIYEPFKAGQTLDPKKDIKINHNCAKWNWSLLARGVFALNFEHMFTSNLSFELGGGLTYRDFFYETGKGNDIISNNDNANIKVGPYLEANLRFYPSEGDLEGFFVSPFVRYRGYHVGSAVDEIKYSADYSMSDVGFNIGMQREAWNSGILVESYFGVALRYRVSNEPIIEYDPTLVTPNETKSWVPTITLGFKIGIPF